MSLAKVLVFSSIFLSVVIPASGLVFAHFKKYEFRKYLLTSVLSPFVFYLLLFSAWMSLDWLGNFSKPLYPLIASTAGIAIISYDVYTFQGDMEGYLALFIYLPALLVCITAFALTSTYMLV